MNIYLVRDYRQILRQLVELRRLHDPRANFQSLAKAARIQKSYMSKVVTGRAHLTTDQMFLVCRHLELDGEAARYLELLLEWERTGVEVRRRELSRLIEEARAPHLESQAHLLAEPVTVSTGGLTDYYLDPLNQIVHVCLFIEAFRKDSALLARELHQPPERIVGALSTLERLGLVRRRAGKGAGWELVTTNLHLTRQSPVYRPWRSQLKLMALTRLDMMQATDSYSFANVFSGDRATFEAIRVKFLEFLKDADQMIKPAPDRNVFQMSFDLFPWTKRPE
jgi:uncharacterized protein (TIGR02147 family)